MFTSRDLFHLPRASQGANVRMMASKMEFKFYTPNEVLMHNKPDDLWVSYLGRVVNLTRLVQEYEGSNLLRPLLAFAGKDISHWFDAKTGDLQRHVTSKSNIISPWLLHGPFVHVPLSLPSTNWATNFGKPWWKDDSYVVGFLTKNVRKICICNMLTLEECLIEVCEEETLRRIVDRYLEFNPHARNYTWKYNGKVLNMTKTLDENGITDDCCDFYPLKMADDYYYPCIELFFNDDLTEK